MKCGEWPDYICIITARKVCLFRSIGNGCGALSRARNSLDRVPGPALALLAPARAITFGAFSPSEKAFATRLRLIRRLKSYWRWTARRTRTRVYRVKGSDFHWFGVPGWYIVIVFGQVKILILGPCRKRNHFPACWWTMTSGSARCWRRFRR